MTVEHSASPLGLLILITAPSGAGKDSTLQILRRRGADVHWVTTAVTREPRPGEANGHDHHFLTAEQFERALADGWFLETANVYGRCYGTPLHEVREPLMRGQDVVLRLDVQGARALKSRHPEAVLIYLDPPSIDEAIRRLRARSTESEQEIERRIQAMRDYEMDFAAHADYRIPSVTGAPEAVADAVWAVITAERVRTRPHRLDPESLTPAAAEAQPT